MIVHGQERAGRRATTRSGPTTSRWAASSRSPPCTGGELRIRDVRARRPAHDPARASSGSAARSSSTATTCSCPAGPEAAHQRPTRATPVSKIEDGPWPAFPADLTSIALALATQAEGLVLIHEKMFENRLFFVDKLVSMGARVIVCDPHRAVVSGPSRLHGERMESPDIRAGMAMLIAALCAEGTLGDRQHPPDRPRLRAHRRAAAGAGRAHRARGLERVPV